MANFLLNPVLQANTIQNKDSVSDKLKKLGDNTGNVVFVNSIKEQMSFVGEDWIRESMEFNNNYTYVLPCSNFLHRRNKWIEPLTDIVEKHPINIVLVGLGTQAMIDENPQKIIGELSDKQKRFFSVIAERCKSIGVRGEYTAECLKLLGIKNSIVIGCPSAYKYLDGKFPTLATPSFEKTIATITPSQKMLSTNVLELAIKKHSNWIMQSKDEIVEMYYHNVILKNLQMAIRFPKMKWNKMKSYQKTNGEIFWDFNEWNEYIQRGKFSFAYGTRFHGNMMALRNGVPTLWFIHDMRTLELVKTLKVPGIQYDIGEVCEEELLERCDYSEFYKNYACNVKTYKDFLKENGIYIEK